MDILFVNTVDFLLSNITPPLGLYSLAGVLKRETSLEARVINFDYLNRIGEIQYVDNMDINIENMVEYIYNFHPKVVDFYTMCSSYAVTLCMAERLKERDSSIIIIFGGPQSALCAEDSLNYFPFIDLIGIGEGELYISELMKRLVNHESYTDLKGIAYRDNKGICVTWYDKMIPSEQLSEYTVCDFDYDVSVMQSINYFPIEAGRGCPYDCTFCSTSMFWGRKFRIKPIEQLIQEMKTLNQKYGINTFSLEHDMFTANKRHLINFCERMIEEKLDFTWGCSSRIDVLDEECMKKMRDAGCKRIFIGIETGSQELQKIVHKNLRLEDALEKIILLDKYGFELTVSFIYGFPDETTAYFTDTIKMVQELMIYGIKNLQLHLFIPLPNTYETSKIAESVYFDPTQIEQSVYIANKFNEKLHQMILDYKDVFIQYYTFDSPVRTKYRRMDYLVSAFVVAGSTYKCSTVYVLKKYSLINIYNQYQDLIEKIYNQSEHIPIDQDFDGETRRIYLYTLVENIIQDAIRKYDEDSLKEIYKFEHELYEYRLEKNQESRILYSPYDILSAINTGEILKKESFICVSKEETKIILKSINVTDELKRVLAAH